jgi:hypothetical protein
MKKYDVIVLDTANIALKEILKFEIESGQTLSGATAFRDKILDAMDNLDIFPKLVKRYIRDIWQKSLTDIYSFIEWTR